MKKINRIRNILLISFAVIFVAAAGIGEATAYFTTYADAEGGYKVNLSYETEIKEGFYKGQKHVTITNTEGAPVFIRAKAFSVEALGDSRNEKWTSIDQCEYENRNADTEEEWYYYTDILNGGDSTEELVITVTLPADAKDGDIFNVVVVYESTLVRYNDEGKPYADWSKKLDIVEDELDVVVKEGEGGNE